MAPGHRDDEVQPLFGRESLFRKKLNEIRTTGQNSGMAQADSRIRLNEIGKSTYLENVASTLAKSDPQDLERITLLDSLTQVYNHNTILRILKDEVKRARRYKFSIALLMIGVDGLRDINEKNGPIITDSILKGVAEFLMNGIRDVDIPARYDAEHFLILCPQTDAAGASVLAERLQGRIAAEQISEDLRNWTVTISSGIAVYPSDGVTAEDLVGKANLLMAEAQQRGGNTYALSR